jgi:hypothetical protein
MTLWGIGEVVVQCVKDAGGVDVVAPNPALRFSADKYMDDRGGRVSFEGWTYTWTQAGMTAPFCCTGPSLCVCIGWGCVAVEVALP